LVSGQYVACAQKFTSPPQSHQRSARPAVHVPL
jgi:hypothetical protein